jgi:hypothetical protein
MGSTGRSMRNPSRQAARSYLTDPERFAETHDPETLARQVPLKAKAPRAAAAGEADPRDS